MGATNLPAAIASVTYDDSNQITTWGTTSFTYDANGNLTSDGVRTYTWDIRNQLMSLSGPVAASFAYDAMGRRRSKTIGSTTTGFLYDGLNPVQELSGGSVTANLLTGLGIDEYFTRTDSSGVRNYLTDALGSTAALTDGSAVVQTDSAAARLARAAGARPRAPDADRQRLRPRRASGGGDPASAKKGCATAGRENAPDGCC